MSSVAEHLAELTGLRDRDVFDVTLVSALRDLLCPDEVAIYRCTGEAGAQVWLTRARLALGDTTARADPLWAEPGTLPPLAAHPERHRCLLQQSCFVVPGPPERAFFPLATELQAVGVLELVRAQPLSADELRLVASILRIYRNFQGLLDYSERDTLTGLLNRKTFDDSFLRVSTAAAPVPAGGAGTEVRRVSRADNLWLGVVDIDHFKRVNDDFGHLIGDEVLLLLSRVMRSNFRFHDHLYRFGGEEFVVLMRCADAGAATMVLERLRASVETYPFPQVGRITVSVGFTGLRPGDTPNEAFDRADMALYHVKQNGRNQVAHHGGLVAAGHLRDRANDNEVELF